MDENKKKLVKHGYDQYAKREGVNRNPQDDLQHLERFAERLKPPARILDIGCGTGKPVDEFLIKKGYKVTGIDISEGMVKKARENFPQGKFLPMDMEEIEFHPKSFDAVVAFHSVYHLPKEKHPILFKKINKILVKNGYLLLTSGLEEEDKIDKLEEGISMYWSHYSKDKIQELLRQSGFFIAYSETHTSGGKQHLIILAKKAQ